MINFLSLNNLPSQELQASSSREPDRQIDPSQSKSPSFRLGEFPYPQRRANSLSSRLSNDTLSLERAQRAKKFTNACFALDERIGNSNTPGEFLGTIKLMQDTFNFLRPSHIDTNKLAYYENIDAYNGALYLKKLIDKNPEFFLNSKACRDQAQIIIDKIPNKEREEILAWIKENEILQLACCEDIKNTLKENHYDFSKFDKEKINYLMQGIIKLDFSTIKKKVVTEKNLHQFGICAASYPETSRTLKVLKLVKHIKKKFFHPNLLVNLNLHDDQFSKLGLSDKMKVNYAYAACRDENKLLSRLQEAKRLKENKFYDELVDLLNSSLDKKQPHTIANNEKLNLDFLKKYYKFSPEFEKYGFEEDVIRRHVNGKDERELQVFLDGVEAHRSEVIAAITSGMP